MPNLLFNRRILLNNAGSNAGGGVPNTFAGYGDSTMFTSGASVTARGWPVLAAGDAGWDLYNAGVPGQDLTAMVNNALADTTHAAWFAAVMDYPNTGETAAGRIAEYKRLASGRPGFTFFMPPVLQSPSGQPDARQAVIEAEQALLLSDPFFAGRTLDATEQAAYIAALNKDYTRAGGADWLHFNDSGQAIQAHFFTIAMQRIGRMATRPEATALIARMTGQPAAHRQRVIGALTSRLVGAGLWSKYDVLRIRAAHDEQATNLNWLANQYDAVKVGTVAFVADRGHTGDGSTGYHNSGFNPATALAPKFTQDSAHFAVWALSNVAENKEAFGGGNSLLRLRAADNSRSGRINNTSTTPIGSGIGTSVGQVTMSRRDNANLKYASGMYSSEGSVAAASVAPASGSFLEGSGPVLPFATTQIAILSWGAGFTLTEMQDDYLAKGAYLAAIGAI